MKNNHIGADASPGREDSAFCGAQHHYQLPVWQSLTQDAWSEATALTVTTAGARSQVLCRQLPLRLGLEARIPRGPIWSDAEALSVHLPAVVEAAAGASLVWADPYLPAADSGPAAAVFSACGFQPGQHLPTDYRATVQVAVQRPVAKLRAGLRRSVKTQLNRGRRAGVTVERLDPGAAALWRPALLALYGRMAERQGLAPLRQDAFDQLATLGGRVLLLAARWQGVLVAFVACIVSGPRLIYHLGASSQDSGHRSLPLSHSLHWSAMQTARDLGLDWYDFGGYWAGLGGDNPINRFKAGFGGDVLELMPPMVRYLQPVRGRMLSTAWRFRRLRR